MLGDDSEIDSLIHLKKNKLKKKHVTIGTFRISKMVDPVPHHEVGVSLTSPIISRIQITSTPFVQVISNYM